MENLEEERNYDLPEIQVVIKERLPDSIIQGPETLVETVEEDSPMTEDINVQTINMFSLSDEQVEPDQDDLEESSNDTVNEVSHHQPLDPDTARIHSRIDACIQSWRDLTHCGCWRPARMHFHFRVRTKTENKCARRSAG